MSRMTTNDHTKPRAPFAPWDRRELPGIFSVEDSARRVGHYKWAETKLFEVLGGWVATVPELDVKMVLGRHAWFHAEHAKRWDERLPELREMNRERLNVPPNAEDRKSTRLNSSHLGISYAVFCLKKKKRKISPTNGNNIN